MGTSINCYNANFIIPKPIFYVFSLLSFIENLISALFNHLGLSEFLETDMVWLESSTRTTSESTILIQKSLPVMKFEELVDPPENCAVCLYEFEGREEIRWLSNCGHVFHRACLDEWMDHDQKRCPLCRTPLLFNTDKNIGEFS